MFSVRVAGNIINEDILSSMEFACKVAGSKIIVVLGHSKCGAVKGACDHVEIGNLTALLNKIQPAVFSEKNREGRPHLRQPGICGKSSPDKREADRAGHSGAQPDTEGND